MRQMTLFIAAALLRSCRATYPQCRLLLLRWSDFHSQAQRPRSHPGRRSDRRTVDKGCRAAHRARLIGHWWGLLTTMNRFDGHRAVGPLNRVGVERAPAPSEIFGNARRGPHRVRESGGCRFLWQGRRRKAHDRFLVLGAIKARADSTATP